ncbi:hypothetical protein EGW08_009196 [Elysia chlorotica]|uniref:Sm domain-containing protein n=1 Tax=Elysia chlorotica TaxID=188477 RepID=A0A3S1A5B0_ELYCH|nr:hypothetical protein EGW08_009196 [Elysia chlorotica]
MKIVDGMVEGTRGRGGRRISWVKNVKDSTGMKISECCEILLERERCICGTLHSVDQFLNIKLTDINVTDPEKYPHMLSVKTCFIRGSVVRYVQLPADECDTQLLQDATRKEAAQNKQR